jgi:hypothetical protein
MGRVANVTRRVNMASYPRLPVRSVPDEKKEIKFVLSRVSSARIYGILEKKSLYLPLSMLREHPQKMRRP